MYKYKSIWQERREERREWKNFRAVVNHCPFRFGLEEYSVGIGPPSLDQKKNTIPYPPSFFFQIWGPSQKKIDESTHNNNGCVCNKSQAFQIFSLLFCCVCRRTGTGSSFLFKPPQIKKYLFCRFRVGFTLRRIPSAPNQTKEEEEEEEEPYCSTNFLL